MFVAGFLALGLAIDSWRRPARTPRLLALTLLSVMIWSLCGAMEAWSPAVPAKVFWTQVSYLGTCTVGSFLLLFSLSWAGRDAWLRPWRVAALFVVPCFGMIMAWTNAWHGLVWPSVTAAPNAPLPTAIFAHGPAWWVIEIWILGSCAIATLILLGVALSMLRIFAVQSIAFAVATMLPWVAGFLYTTGVWPAWVGDPTPAAFVLTGAVIAWALRRLRAFDVLPLARGLLVETMGDGILVADTAANVIDLNPSARRLLQLDDGVPVVGVPLQEMSTAWPGLASALSPAPGSETCAVHRDGSGDRWIETRYLPIEVGHVGRGWLIQIRDVSKLHRLEASLERQRRLLRGVEAMAETLLRAPSWRKRLQPALAPIGRAAGADEVNVVRCETGAEAEPQPRLIYSWSDVGVDDTSLNDLPRPAAWPAGETAQWRATLQSGGHVVSAAGEPHRRQDDPAGDPDGRSSRAAVPVFVAGDWWGAIEFAGWDPRQDWSQEEIKALRLAADMLGAAIERDVVTGQARQLQRTIVEITSTMGSLVQCRDRLLAAHQTRVAKLVAAIGRELGCGESVLTGIELAAGVHDIGQIAIPSEILKRPGPLTAKEMGLVRRHPDIGAEMLADIPFEQPVAAIVRQHHERLDGSGYPARLHAGDILLEARILAVADVVEAMVSHRPWREALPLEEALDFICASAGRAFDKSVCEACVSVTRRGDVDLSPATSSAFAAALPFVSH